jgi:hypothetical protein
MSKGVLLLSVCLVCGERAFGECGRRGRQRAVAGRFDGAGIARFLFIDSMPEPLAKQA